MNDMANKINKDLKKIVNMTKNTALACFLALQILYFFACSVNDNSIVFFDAEKGGEIIEQGVTTELKNGELFVTTTSGSSNPGVVFRGDWHLSASSEILLVVSNYGDQPVTLKCRFESPQLPDNTQNVSRSNTQPMKGVNVSPGETQHARLRLPVKVPDALKNKFFAMRGNPFGMHLDLNSAFDPQVISQLVLYMNEPKGVETCWSVKLIAAFPVEPGLSHIPEDKFFPMIDKYGQFIHRDWPGKIYQDIDLKKAYEVELADLAANPSPKDRSKYGGWTAGPKLEATGHFRVEKLDGKWWLVDPDGFLFWSHGTDCVSTGNATTALTDREFYFAELPPRDGPYASCYGTGSSHMWYYKDHGIFQTFDFSKANLIRKYGENWEGIYSNLVHQRLRSWGMNTIANWSSPQFYQMQRTPYTESLNVRGQVIKGSQGYWGQFIDPFDPQFRETIKQSAMRAAQTSGRDPWCIGYFVGNEISWGNETSLAMASLVSPADQPSKIAVVEQLKKKYGDITKLNTVWQSNYESWKALLHSTESPNVKNAREDLLEGHRMIAEYYFRVISEEVHAACPNKLYMGCRIDSNNPAATSAAAKYCDVISFNRYDEHLDYFDLWLPEGVDKPCIIGEFHFGALDRGMFHTGLWPTESQIARAAAYERYVRSAINNRHIVGTHWFQYMDQATTGRSLDGENYQIGLVTSCDSPYPETIEALRKIGNIMYTERYRGVSKK